MPAKTTTKKYPAFFYRQRPDSPVLASFVASSADVHDWAAVPTKTDKDPTNFQRPENVAHAREISEFYRSHSVNSSPSSLIIGFRRPPRVLDAIGEKALNLTDIGNDALVQGILEIEFELDPSAFADEDKRTVLHEMIPVEVNRIKREVADLLRSSTPQSDEGEPDSDDEDDDDGDGGELNPSEKRSPAEDALGEKRRYLQALEALDPLTLHDAEAARWIRELHDSRKPGLLIDGQHRVKGTCAQKNTLFTVNAFPDANWAELAFHFIILNKTAQQVPDSLLINIVGNSMSAIELGSIEQRLNTSGIKVPLYQGVMKLHEDPSSPFYRRLRFGLKNGDAAGEIGLLDAAAVKGKLVRYWYSCPQFEMLSHLIPGRSRREKLGTPSKPGNWQTSGQWYEFLSRFWNEARKRYEENSSLWSAELEDDRRTPKSPLMKVTVLSLIQTAFLDSLAGYLSSQKENEDKTWEELLPDQDKFFWWVGEYFKRLQPEFFSEWGPAGRGLDGNKQSRDSFKHAITLVITKKKQISDLKSAAKPENAHLLYKK
jgi:hypothetical protein